MKSKAVLGFIVVFMMIVNVSVNGFDQSMTRKIRNTNQDIFVLPTGVARDANFMVVLDPFNDIRGMLFFEDIKVNTWHNIYNATLRLRTFQYRAFDNESKITIYGVTDYAMFGYGSKYMDAPQSPSAILGLPLTSASVVYNTSEFDGAQWHEIDVTVLVNEMKNNRNYDGPGLVQSNTGDNMIFVIYGVKGYNDRMFYDFRAGNGLQAQLVIHWTDSPPPPSGGTYNSSYQGINIFEIDLIGENRTGINADVNWNLLDQTELTEIDSGVSIAVQNATWTVLTAFQDQAVNSLYNDTGGLNVNSFFVRFAINMTNVTNGGISNDMSAVVVGLGTATPVGSGGMLTGAVGDHAGLVFMCDVDDTRYLFRLYDRSGAARTYSTTSGWRNEGSIYYFEYYATNTWESIRMYSDPEFTVLDWSDIRVYEEASGPFQFVRIIETVGQWGSGGKFISNADYFTYSEMPLANATSWTVAFENGTIIEEDLEDYEDAIIVIDDLLGIESDDPDPEAQGWEETGPFTRFRTRLYILAMGVGLLFGPLMVFAYRRPSGYEFVIGAFLMLIGYSLMLAAGQV